MAKYTTELRTVCEQFAGRKAPAPYGDIRAIIDAAAPKIFDMPYPIFDDAYKSVLERKILMHYYTRELCCEPVALWKLRLNSRMCEIMPYYNQLYESQLIKFNPLWDVDLQRAHSRDETQNDQAESQSDGQSGTTNSQHTAGTKGELTTRDLHTTTDENGSSTVKTTGEKGGNEKVTIDNTLEKTGTDTTKTDATMDTTTSSTGSGTTTTNGTSKLSGTDTTSDTGSETTSGEMTGANLETRNLTTDTDKKETAQTRFSDTPQNSVENVIRDGYMTTFTYVEGSGNTLSTEKGNVDTDKTEKTSGEKNVDLEHSTRYGKTQTDSSSGDYNESESGTGKQVTDGTATQTKDLLDTGHETRITERALTDGSQSTTQNTGSGSGAETGTINVDGSNSQWMTGEQTGRTQNIVTEKRDIMTLESYMERVKGRNGVRSPAAMLREFRETFLNIDRDIINDLYDLFFLLW